MQIILITGASDGIGAELARQLAKQLGPDVHLVLAARQEALLQQVATTCQALGSSVSVIRTDVSDPQQCRQLIDTTVAQCGGMDAVSYTHLRAHETG
jgi:NAD(P)-dependent dehydrogenase (short-subunit alcohol dehydrogenase family)